MATTKARCLGIATWSRIRASISANSLAASTGSSAGFTSQWGSSSFSASCWILAASTAFSSSFTGVLYFLASRASCCAYCNGVRPARLMTTSFVNSGVGPEFELSAFAAAASALAQASAKLSISSVIGKTFENLLWDSAIFAKLVPGALERNVVRHEAPQPSKPLGLDLDGEAARPIAVILEGGIVPGRRIPKGLGFGRRRLDDAGGDQPLEGGPDHAVTSGANMNGFFGPPLAVMHGCADTG